MRRNAMRRAAAIGAAACFVLIGAISMAEAGSVHTNPGGKYLGGERGPVPHQSRRQIPRRQRGQVPHQSRRQIRVPGRRSEVPHQSRRQIRVSRRVRRIRQPPSRVLPQIRLLSLVWPPTLFLWRRVRLPLSTRRGHQQCLLVGSLPQVQRPLLGAIAAFRPGAAVLRSSCESCGASACAGPHFALKAMEKLTLPGARRCRKPCAPLQ